jgi:hypothetical protein
MFMFFITRPEAPFHWPGQGKGEVTVTVPLRYLQVVSLSPLDRGADPAGRATRSFIVSLGIETPLAHAPAERGGDGPRSSRARFDAGRQAEPAKLEDESCSAPNSGRSCIVDAPRAPPSPEAPPLPLACVREHKVPDALDADNDGRIARASKSACSGFNFVVLDMKWNKNGLILLQRPARCLAQAPFSMLDKEGQLGAPAQIQVRARCCEPGSLKRAAQSRSTKPDSEPSCTRAREPYWCQW